MKIFTVLSLLSILLLSLLIVDCEGVGGKRGGRSQRRGCKGKGGGKDGGNTPAPGSGSSIPDESIPEERFKRQTDEAENENPERPEKPKGRGPPGHRGGKRGPGGRREGGRPPQPPQDSNPSNPSNPDDNVQQQQERFKRQSHDAEEFDEQQQRPSVWQEVLQIMGDGVKTIFKSVAEKFHEHEQRGQGEETGEEEEPRA